MQQPSPCRFVLYCFHDRDKGVLVERPAIITSVSSNSVVNLTVFFECDDNDSYARGKSGDLDFDPRYIEVEMNQATLPTANTWRWPPRVV